MRKMKDSGIESFGVIPKEWKVTKLKSILTLRSEKNSGDRELLSVYLNSGVISYSDSTGMQVHKPSQDLSNYQNVYIGDFVLNNQQAWRGSVGVSKYNGIISPAYFVYIIDKCCDFNFMNYLLRDASMVQQYENASRGIGTIQRNIFAPWLLESLIALPEYEEQSMIAAYLNSKYTEIELLISDLQSQIETLEEYKRSVITEAVTKGLDPDVEMRDSGIAWVGDIPAHWITHPLYFYFGERKNKNALGLETNLLSLSYGKIIRKDINSNGGLLPESFNTYNIIEKDDIIIRPTDLQNDKRSLRTGIAREHGIITSAYIAMKAIKSVNPEYFHYLLHAYDVMKVFYNMGNGVRQGLNFSEFSRLMVFEPTIEEQNAIVAYLKEKCDEIDLAIAEKKQQIETIEEYKKSLIFEYVTGKKEVASTLQVVTIHPALMLALVLREFGDDLKGKIHAQKAAYLSEMVLRSRPNAQYYRYEQGPYDEELDNYLKQIHKRQWFTIHNGNPMTCSKGKKYSEFEAKYKDLISKYSSEIKKIVDFLRPMRSSQAGRVATLYAVWNDFMIDGITNPTDSQLIDEVTTNWTPNKSNPDKSTWQDTLNKMKAAGIVPTGYGLHTKAKEMRHI